MYFIEYIIFSLQNEYYSLIVMTVLDLQMVLLKLCGFLSHFSEFPSIPVPFLWISFYSCCISSIPVLFLWISLYSCGFLFCSSGLHWSAPIPAGICGALKGTDIFAGLELLHSVRTHGPKSIRFKYPIPTFLPDQNCCTVSGHMGPSPFSSNIRFRHFCQIRIVAQCPDTWA